MKKQENLFKRSIVYLFGMFFMTIGVNLSVLSGLGVSPIDTLPYVCSLISGLSLGTATTAVFSVYVLLQLLILRKDFHWSSLLQIPVSVVFGWFVSVSGKLTALLPTDVGYPVQFVYMLLSMAFLGTGIFLYVATDIMSMPADGVALALAFRSGKPMSTEKIGYDWFIVAVSVALSLIFLHNISGIREGTFIAAFGVGLCIRFWENHAVQSLRTFLHTA